MLLLLLLRLVGGQKPRGDRRECYIVETVKCVRVCLNYILHAMLYVFMFSCSRLNLISQTNASILRTREDLVGVIGIYEYQWYPALPQSQKSHVTYAMRTKLN